MNKFLSINNWLFQKIERKNVFISTYQIIIFQIDIMDSRSRSRSSPKRQKDVVIKSRSRSPMNIDTQNSKLKNVTKKINLSNIKEESKYNYMNPLKAKEIEIVQNQIMMNLQYESTKNFRTYEVNIFETAKLKAIWLKKDHHFS